MKHLPASFYTKNDVVQIARSLIGKVLHTHIDGFHTSGIIVETEAYNGVVDKASHAYGNRLTNRTKIMYAEGGVAYVYFCYGMHYMFNVVTSVVGTPHAVLIRSLQPWQGIEKMVERRKKTKLDNSMAKGPACVAQAMGLHTRHTGESLMGPAIWITTAEIEIPDLEIIATPRIGVNYAAEDALLPFRFYLASSPYVSGKNKKASAKT